MIWYTLVSSRVVYAPLPYLTEDGEERTRFIPLGVRIHLLKGYWFHSFKHGTWTYHHQRVQRLCPLGKPMETMDGNPVLLPEHIDRYASIGKVLLEYGKRCPGLVGALLEGRDNAMEQAA